MSAPEEGKDATFLRIDLPFIAKQVDQAEIVEWHVDEGGDIRFGDDLCTVRITEINQLNRSGRRHLRRRAGKDDWVATKKVDYQVVVTASDRGYLISQLAAAGTSVRIGEPIGIASSVATEATPPGSADELPGFRVLANETAEAM